MSAVAYAKAAKPAVDAVVASFGGAEGAIDLLTKIRVNAMPYRLLAEERMALSKPLRAAVFDNNLSEFKYATEDVLRACQTNRINDADLEPTLLAVQVLDGFDSAKGELSTWQQLLYAGQHISTTAKVYGYFAPTRWTTFHPPAVARLQAVLAPVVAAHPDLARIVAFPMPQDHGSLATVPDWGQVRSGNDAKLAFLYLSWFLRYVATALSRDSQARRPTVASGRRWIDQAVPWKAHYVEMALAAAHDREKAG
jgi:hypothetical protein